MLTAPRVAINTHSDMYVNSACGSHICSLRPIFAWVQTPKCNREVYLVFSIVAGTPDLSCAPTDKNLGFGLRELGVMDWGLASGELDVMDYHD
jgi:hypothetical protein